MVLDRAGSGRRGGRESGGALYSGREVVEHQLVRVADPNRSVAMIPQRIARIRVEENIQRAVVQRQPFHNVGKLRALESKLVRPFRVRADGFFVEPAELQGIAEMSGDFLAELPGGIAAGGIEVDVGMPGLDCRSVGEGHGGSLALMNSVEVLLAGQWTI
jgi:hypothetical protein